MNRYDDIAADEDKIVAQKGRPIHFTKEKVPIYLSNKSLDEIESILMNTSLIKSFNSTGYATLKGLGDILRIKFIPVQDFSPQMTNNLNFMINHFFECYELFNSQQNHNTLSGTMCAAGWRKAMQRLHGTYGPKINSEYKYNLYLTYLQNMIEFDRIISERFKALAPVPHQQSHNQLVQLQGSSMSHQEIHEPIKDYEFAANVVFTLNGFSNLEHCDQDASEWSYGGFLQVDNARKQFASRADGFDVEGGSFYFPTLNLQINLPNMDGFTEIAWRAGTILHHTLPSKEPSGRFTRIGFSCQTTQKIANEFEKFRHMKEEEIYRLQNMRGQQVPLPRAYVNKYLASHH